MSKPIEDQVQEVFESIYAPGLSRRELGRRGLLGRRITTPATLSTYVNQVVRFAGWCQENYGIRGAGDLTPAMAEEYVQDLRDRGRAGGYVGKMMSAIRKFDLAMRERGDRSPDAPPLIAKTEGWHSDRRPERAYTSAAAERIIEDMGERARDKQTALVAKLLWLTGLWSQEAVSLRAEDIDVEGCRVSVEKGTRRAPARVVQLDAKHRGFLRLLKQRAENHRDGHVFQGRQSLKRRTGGSLRHACRRLEEECYGTMGFRRLFARQRYRQLRLEGVEEGEALRRVAVALGHRRLEDIHSYVPRGL